MNTVFNPRHSLRAFGVLLSVLSVMMMIDAAGFSTTGFPDASPDSLEIATYMHQVFGASIFAFGSLIFGAAMSNEPARCMRIAKLASCSFLPSVLVMTYHWTGPVPDVMAPALLNTVMWLWVLLSGFLYKPEA